MKKINEQNAKRQEEAQRRKEELDAKLREVEENKRKLMEEKKRDEHEKQKAKERHQLPAGQSQLGVIQVTAAAAPKASHQTPAHSKPFSNNYSNKVISNHTENSSTKANYDVLTSFKSIHNTKPPAQQQAAAAAATLPLQPINNLKAEPKLDVCPKILTFSNQLSENYDINDLKSEDETDDDEEPNKPIPEWAKDLRLKRTAMAQARKFLNYTRLFSASSQNDIVLEDIFKIKRKKFTERSSSAIWNSPPVWRTNGLNGNESFRLLHK